MNRRQGTTIAVTAVALLATAAPAATAAAPAARPAQDGRPALVTGRSTDGRATFRLEGRRLTVTLARRLAPKGFSGRPSVKVVCGDDAQGDLGLAYRDLADVAFAVQASRGLRLHPGVRTIRAQLDRDVAARANWCGLRWSDRGTTRLLAARMTLRRGTAPGCAPADPATVVVETERLLVEWASRPTDGYSYATFRSCVKPDGRWRSLTRASSSRYETVGPMWWAAHGTWVAWQFVNAPNDDPCVLQRLDVAAATAPQRIAPTPTPGQRACVRNIAVGPDGTLAWVAYTDGERESLNALTAAGATIALDAGPFNSLADLAISADGSTLTWRNGGQARSAPMP